MLRGLVFLVMVVGVVAGAYFGTIKVHTVAAPPKYYYEGYGEFSPDRALDITSDRERQATVDLLPNGNVFVMYSFNDSKPDKFGFTPTKENHRSAWIWLPCALIAVGVEFMVMLLVMLLVGVEPDGSP